jgi:hypothetical protein
MHMSSETTMSTPTPKRDYGLVKRANAEGYLLIMLIAFALSVIGTRVYLDLANYPRIGGDGPYHIAHVLWGGLLLFAGAVMPLTFMNRRMFDISAVLTGAGMGLFIDEVGKFITSSNDYFAPLAAPIIYVFFVATVIFYLRVRSARTSGSRRTLYKALDRMTDVADHALDAQQREQQHNLLERVLYDEHASDDMKALAEGLMNVLNHPALDIRPREEGVIARLRSRLEALERLYFTRMRARVALAGGLMILSIFPLVTLMSTVTTLADPAMADALIFDWVLTSDPRFLGPASFLWQIVLLVLQGVVGAGIFASGVLLLLRRDDIATRIGFMCLLVTLTVVNMLTFYFNQFAAVVTASVELALLLAITRFRTRFLNQGDTPQVMAQMLKPIHVPSLSGAPEKNGNG